MTSVSLNAGAAVVAIMIPVAILAFFLFMAYGDGILKAINKRSDVRLEEAKSAAKIWSDTRE